MKYDKHECNECKDLPEGDVINGHDHRMTYDKFIREGRASCFTDSQLDFMERWFTDFSHEE